MKIDLKKGDCLELMKEIPDGSVDMILCDLPYGTTARNKWDIQISCDKLWVQYKRIVKSGGAIVLFSQQPFTTKLVNSNLDWFRYEWVWQKQQGTGHLNAKKMPMKAHENILVFYEKLPTYNPQMREGKPYVCKSGKPSSNYREQMSVITENDGFRYPVDVIKFASEKGLHPTQKPVALLEYLIKTYTNENEVVLDNCMGSGSTGVACTNTNRNFIGIELDNNYFDIAKKRIETRMKELGWLDE